MNLTLYKGMSDARLEGLEKQRKNAQFWTSLKSKHFMKSKILAVFNYKLHPD